MTGAALTTNERRLEPTSALREIARAERFDVRLRFGSAALASRYLRALTSLLVGASTKVTATLTTGAPREDLTAEEIADRLERAGINKLRFALRFSEYAIALELALFGSEPGAVAIRAPFTSGPVTARLWLQSDVDVVAPRDGVEPRTRGRSIGEVEAHEPHVGSAS